MITNVSLPLLVRDWLNKRCKANTCFFVKEFYIIKFDPLKNIEEKVLDTIVVTSSDPGFYSNYIMDVTLIKCVIDYWKKDPRSAPNSYELTRVHTLNYDFKDPSFFRKIGRIVKCRCKKLASTK